jgi:hypothetical protein
MAVRRTGIRAQGRITNLVFSGTQGTGSSRVNVAFTRENGQTIAAYILKDILEGIFNKVVQKLKAQYPSILLEILESDPDISAWLAHNSFYGQIGVVDPESAIHEIANRIASTFQADTFVESPSSIRKIKLTADFVFLDVNHIQTLAAMDFGSFESTNQDGEITVVPWLSWLVDTPSPAVPDYFYTKNSRVKNYSRTGQGIMVPNSNRQWDVPAQYDGTPNDNFITRAVNGGVGLIELKLLQMLEKSIPQTINK